MMIKKSFLSKKFNVIPPFKFLNWYGQASAAINNATVTVSLLLKKKDCRAWQSAYWHQKSKSARYKQWANNNGFQMLCNVMLMIFLSYFFFYIFIQIHSPFFFLSARSTSNSRSSGSGSDIFFFCFLS